MKYNKNKKPPAPTAKVILRNIETLESISNVPMLLDTGSDITLLPKSFCEEIGVAISETDFLELEGFNNATSLAFYVRLEFIFLNKMFRGNFLAYDNDEGIIGRNILNKFSLVFDGKNLSWYELEYKER
jgi:predicted aspartyl protease